MSVLIYVIITKMSAWSPPAAAARQPPNASPTGGGPDDSRRSGPAGRGCAPNINILNIYTYM